MLQGRGSLGCSSVFVMGQGLKGCFSHSLCPLAEGEQVVSVSELASVPCCGDVFETPGKCAFPGMHHLPEGQVGVLRMLSATPAYSKAGRVAGSAPGHSIQAGALAWAVSRLSPGWFAAWEPHWQGHPGGYRCYREGSYWAQSCVLS